ncbi:MAG TPA: MgtC/SapB family protein [Gaiellaceae bacterium]
MLFSLPALTWPEVLLRLALAAAFGAAIGVERELREREAGLRTHLLVSLGSALFTIVSAYGFREFLVNGGAVIRADPTRIAAQIVTGIGFLGAGAIIRQGLAVRGLTTAATLWVVAAIGLASGAGYYSAAAIATVLVLLSLWPLRLLAYRIFVRYRPERERLIVDLERGRPPGVVLDAVEAAGAHVESLAIADEGERRSIALEVDFPPRTRDAVLHAITDLEGVKTVQWAE